MTYQEAVKSLSHTFSFVKLNSSSTPLFFLKQLDMRQIIGGPFFLRANGNDYEMVYGEEALDLYDKYEKQIEGTLR